MNKLQEEAKAKTAEWITKSYGPRCKALSHGCPTCDMWKIFDILFADIDSGYTWSEKIRDTPDDKLIQSIVDDKEIEITLTDKKPNKKS